MNKNALYYAVVYGEIEVVKLLIAQGAEINQSDLNQILEVD
jgi:ankyrin repeat protein